MEDTITSLEVSGVSPVSKQKYSPGFQAQRVTVVSNLYTVDSLKDVTVYQWGISFDPPLEKDSRQVRNQLLAENGPEIFKRLGIFFHSGEVLSCLKLPELQETRMELIASKQYKLILKNLEKPVSLAIQFQNPDMQKRVIQILNNNLKKCFKLIGLVEFGRSGKFYNMAESNLVQSKGYKLNIRKGFHTTFDFYQGHVPRVLIDTSCRIVRESSMWDDYCYCVDEDEEMPDIEIFDTYILGKNFLANYGNYRIYNIARVDQKKTPLSAFPDQAKAKTYKEYFQKQYQKEIKYDKQFLVVAINTIKKLVNGVMQEVEEEIHLVPELLLPTGLTDELRNDFKTMQ